MKVDENMNLADLAERMGNQATPGEAAAMRDLLIPQYEGRDTVHIPEPEWLAMLKHAAEN